MARRHNGPITEGLVLVAGVAAGCSEGPNYEKARQNLARVEQVRENPKTEPVELGARPARGGSWHRSE